MTERNTRLDVRSPFPRRTRRVLSYYKFLYRSGASGYWLKRASHSIRFLAISSS